MIGKFTLFLFGLLLYPDLLIYSQSIKVNSFEDIKPLLHKQNDTLYLVNFWATWCVPCVKELPEIEKVAKEYQNAKFKVLLISLDMPGQIDSRLIPFIKKNNVESEVILLNDPDFNSWIDEVDPNWSGAIPASVIYRNNNREFFEQSFSYNELKEIILTKIK